MIYEGNKIRDRVMFEFNLRKKNFRDKSMQVHATHLECAPKSIDMQSDGEKMQVEVNRQLEENSLNERLTNENVAKPKVVLERLKVIMGMIDKVITRKFLK